MNERESRRAAKVALIAISIWAAYQLGLQVFTMLGTFLFSMLLAWLLSIAMEPPVAWFERHGQRRGLGAGLVLLGGVLFAVIFLGTLGTLMFSQLAAAVESAPSAVTSLIEWLNANFDLNLDKEQILASLHLETSSLAPILTDLAGGTLGVVGGVFSALFEFLTILVFAFYFSADAPKLKRHIASWLAPNNQKVFMTVWEIAVTKAGGFVVSRVVLAFISAVAHVGFFWAIDVPYWMPMGIFAGITAQFIPTIGTYLGIAVPVLFAVTSEPIDALWIVVFATVYQQIENYILTPKVSRATMDMHPALALGAVIIGAAIFGPIGALIGIPMVAALLAIGETYGRRHELIAEFAITPEAAAD